MASVFSGIGGEMVAATMMGWDVQFFCEKNEFGRTVLEYWYPNAKSYEDITTTDFSEWRGRIDVLTGGFPCQPFSYAGKRGGATDDRYLWPFMFRCIDQIRPTWVVAENVAGITTMVEQGEVSQMASAPTLFDEGDNVRGEYVLRETFTLERICNDLERHGYSVQTVLIPALSVGAPHRRDRVFIVARREDSVDGETLHEERTESGRPIADTESNGDSRRPRQVCEEERRPSEFNAEPCINGEVRLAAHTADNGLQHSVASRGEGCETGTIQGQGCYAERNVSVTADGCGGNTTNTAIEGLERRDNGDTQGHGQSEDGRSGLAGQRLGGERYDNTENAMCNGRTFGHEEECSEYFEYWNTRAGDTEWLCGKARLEDSDEVGSMWREFPTVSPVHSANDGIPFDMANLSISFSKWRNESLKACGNAIVPAVVYEIFRAIQHVENIQH